MAQRKEDASGIIPLPSSNCWWSDEVISPQSQTTSYRDFVLISEFSELEGPLPLAIVADSTYIDLKHYTHRQSTAATSETRSLEEDLKKIGLDAFDFNAFVLRVVSVDRSTEYEQIDEDTLEITPISPSDVLEGEEEIQKPCLFSIPDDTQVYFTDSEHKFFAFTHHLTLFDINARGYVHPVALSYITRDPHKIVIRFEELMERFNEVSVRMKKGNYSNFTLDLKCRLLDLEYTQSILTNVDIQQQKSGLSIQTIQQAITATKLMIDTLESSASQINNMTSKSDSAPILPPEEEPKLDKNPTPLRKSLSKRLLNMKNALAEDDDDSDSAIVKNQFSIDPPKDYKPKCIDTLYPVPHFERKLRSLAQLCQEPEEDSDEVAYNNHPSLTQKTAAMIPLVFSMIESSITPIMSASSSAATNDTVTPSNAVIGRPSFATTITHDMYAEAIKSLQDMTHYLGKSSVVLDVDEEERLFLDPISSALTIGRTFMFNMNNPQPREPEEHSTPASPNPKDDTFEKTSDKNTTNNCNSNSSTSKTTSSVETNTGHTSNDDSQSTINTSLDNDNDDNYPILFAPIQLWQPSKIHLLEVLRRYQSLIVDVIFSLLIGRTVLIQGSAKNKSLIQRVVRALAVFVPGQSRHRHQIIEWFGARRLTDTQIKSIKLVGIDKVNTDSSIHIDSSCVLDIDVENGSLNSSPVYIEGQWINQLLDRMMLFSSDESYLAYLHTVFMTMSLKAFIYHHLYVCDEFKLDGETPPSVTSNKGYVSESNSENSSMLSGKWSQRLMSYLKKHEDDNDVPIPPSAPDPAPVLATAVSSQASSVVTVEEEEDYSEENQATVTLQNLLLHQQQQHQTFIESSKPRTVVGMFDQPTRRASISTTYSRESFSSSNSDGSEEESGLEATVYLNNVKDVDELIMNYNDDEESSSGESEQEEKRKMRARKGKHRYARRKSSNVGEDGVSLSERRGRRYLQDKLKVYGDDQTIVVYLATCVL